MNIDLPDAPRLRDKLAAAGLFVLIGASGMTGYWIGAARTPVAEDITRADAQRQVDGSLILARAPDAAPPPAPHALPRKAQEMRRVTVVVKPTSRQATLDDCAPVTVTTSLVRDGNGLRAIASAQNGTVLSGADTPIRALNLAPPPRVWAAGAAYALTPHDAYGAWISRDFGRLRIGADLLLQSDQRVSVIARAGITF